MRVILADDGVLFRTGLARLLGDAGIEVTAEAGDVPELLGKLGTVQADVAVLDIRMPPSYTTEGLDAARELHRCRPEVAVLVLSQYAEPQHALTLLAQRPRSVGYLLKDRVAHLRDMVSALRRVSSGGVVVDPEVVGGLLDGRRAAAALDRLTQREHDVLRRLAEGRSNSAIAADLEVGLRTVETHIAAVFDKLGLTAGADSHRRVLAVLEYLRGYSR